MSAQKSTENWFTKHIESEARKDTLSYSDRVGNVVALVVIILVILYFAAHQIGSTGFFTSKFGVAETILFYGVIIYQIVPNALKALLGRKNFARPFDIISSVLLTVALAWLLVVFPFDFAYFADVLPSFLRFLLQWISNDIAKALMVIGLIVAPVMAIYQTTLYIFVRRELRKSASRTT